MNHDDLGNYSHSYVADLRAQLQAANERAEKAEEINHRLTTMCRAYSVDPAKIGNTEIAITRIAQDEHMALLNRLAASQQTSAALKAEVERLTGIERSYNAQRNLPPDQRTIPDDDAGRAAYWKGRAKAIEGDFAKLSDALLKEGEAKDAALALNDTLAGALKELVDQDDHQEPFNGLDMSNGRAALSAYAKAKEAQP